MGLAQLLERPRNWQSPRDALNLAQFQPPSLLDYKCCLLIL